MNAINEAIIQCDIRLQSISAALLNHSFRAGMRKLMDLDPQEYKMEGYVLSSKIVNLEKLIYKALLKKERRIFGLYLAKYDEILGDSYEISKGWVLAGDIEENDHLEYCKNAMEQREYIKKICTAGGF